MNLRAPTEHGQVLAVPPLDQIASLLERNAALLDQAPHPLPDLRALARREVLDASTRYHQEAGEPVPETTSERWMVAGHQPELFHPGVWFKNFALHHLADRHRAMPLNLVIDSDAAKPALLHVPADDRLARLAYDRSVLDTPYEERAVLEEATFADLPNRVAAITARWPFEPMLPAFWQEVQRQAARTPLLGERFAAARRATERRLGCMQREAPMSRLCQTEAFARFACLILRRMPEFHGVYNAVVRDYRRAHGIRSRNHPVPDLASAGDWLETPFWAWRRGQCRRGKLFVRPQAGALALRIGQDEGPVLPDSDAAADAWRELEPAGVKVRTRALTTTMFARLLLADVFIHGIGGGVYDELTDRIIERFFGLPAPAYLVLSATLHLPLPRYPDAASRQAQLARRQRDLTYKPECFLAEPSVASERKRAWIHRTPATHRERVERFEQLRALNAQMHPLVAAERDRVQTHLAEYRRLADVDAVGSRRDYAFCLYPEPGLRELDVLARHLGT